MCSLNSACTIKSFEKCHHAVFLHYRSQTENVLAEAEGMSDKKVGGGSMKCKNYWDSHLVTYEWRISMCTSKIKYIIYISV